MFTSQSLRFKAIIGSGGWSRTSDRTVINRVLYPPELPRYPLQQISCFMVWTTSTRSFSASITASMDL